MDHTRGTPALKLQPRFDVARLQAEYSNLLTKSWLPHFNTGTYEGRWDGLPLRSPGGTTAHLFPFEPGRPSAVESFSDTELLEQSGYLTQVLASFQCDITSARLLVLDPGSEIKEHHDGDINVSHGVARLHVPIHSNPDVVFFVAGELIPFAEGDCWYIDAGRLHRVVNGGQRPRVHLVLDAIVNPWLRDLLTAAGYREEQDESKYGDPNITDHNVEKIIRALEQNPGQAAREQAQRLKAVREGQ